MNLLPNINYRINSLIKSKTSKNIDGIVEIIKPGSFLLIYTHLH
jgi:hypothetical protein